MKHILVLGIGYDESNWNIETFSEKRKVFLLELVGKYKTFKGRYLDNLERVEFSIGTPELEKLIRKECDSKNFIYDIGIRSIYSDKDINGARYVPLLTECGPLDSDSQGVALNEYESVLCKSCGRCDENQVPNPYKIGKKVLKKSPDIFCASNGVVVISNNALQKIWDDIYSWVICGDVVIIDNKQIIECSKKYKWIRPVKEIGAFTNAKILKRCSSCEQPIEIRKVRLQNIFEASKESVKSFNDIESPIVLAGNWFGEIVPQKPCSNHWQVLMSGTLHEKVNKTKMVGFVKADYIIHSEEEYV